MFSDRFSGFDTIPECDSQPPSHVAVAITLNAKASSLKTAVYLQVITAKLHIENGKKIMNIDITLEARWLWQSAAKVISPFIIFAVFDVSFRRYNL